jgi:transcriptional regulator with XRE-family HTH domain
MSNGVTVQHMGDRIRFYRQKMELTQRELGGYIGLTWFKMAQIENGTRAATNRQVEQLAHLLGVPVRKLTENTVMKADKQMRHVLRLMEGGAYIDTATADPDLLRDDGEMLECVPKTCFQRLVGGAFIEPDEAGHYRINADGRAELYY